jgi:hypothetical protein
MTISNSTIANNFAINGTDWGGGILNEGGMLTISNSTIASNSSSNLEGWGGGIFNIGPVGTTLTINNSTVAGNSATRGGGIFNYPNDIINARNTLVAGNMASTAPDLSGDLGSLGHNLIGNTQGGSGFDPTDLLNVDPLLGPLQDNGGPTQTMALLPGSQAIDAGDNTNAPDWDQRGPGFPRIVNGIIDIGAFEVQDGRGGGAASPGGRANRHSHAVDKALPLDVSTILSSAISPSQASSPSPTPASAPTKGTLAGQEVAVVDRLFASLHQGDAGFASARLKLVLPIGPGAQDRIVTFLAWDGKKIIRPEPACFFDTAVPEGKQSDEWGR